MNVKKMEEKKERSRSRANHADVCHFDHISKAFHFSGIFLTSDARFRTRNIIQFAACQFI